MIVVNYLDTILSNDLIEMSLWNHFFGLSKGILFDLRMMKYGSKLLCWMQVDTNLPLVVGLVKIHIWHLHLFFMHGFVSRKKVVVFFETFLS